jgi:hypothetical protein
MLDNVTNVLDSFNKRIRGVIGTTTGIDTVMFFCLHILCDAATLFNKSNICDMRKSDKVISGTANCIKKSVELPSSPKIDSLH